MKKMSILFIFTMLGLWGWHVFSCTGFTASPGDRVLIGNTEDYYIDYKDTVVRIRPAAEGKYGCVLVGFDRQDFSMGGINERGLFYDWFSVPSCDQWRYSPDKSDFNNFKPENMLEVCADVEEAIAFFQRYNLQIFRENHVFVVDKTGAAAIIEWGENDLEVIRKQGNFQVITNFFVSHPERGGSPCRRYDTAVDMLENSPQFSFDLCHDILEAVSVETASVATQYSNIYEIREGDMSMYIFNFHNHDEFIKLDINEELKKGPMDYQLPEHLSEIELYAPGDGAVVSPSPVRFRWTGKENSDYRLYYSTDPGFTGCVPIDVTGPASASLSGTGIGFFFIGMLSLGTFYKRRKKLFTLICVLLLTMVCIMTYCARENGNTGADNFPGFEVIAENLQPNATYYWKVTANAGDSLTSESIVRTFTTGN